MRLDSISNLDALLALLALITFSALIFRIVPVGTAPEAPHDYSDDEIRHHDRALLKYPLVTLAALTIGGLHLLVRSLPPVADWLLRGGYGGHLLRDIAYSHMMIVMGGTIAVTGLTWYTLPRILRRPLYSESLAELAFWGTVVGAAGFYLANAIGGGIMATLLHAGWSASEIDFSIGLWRSLATGLFAVVMGVGYWTFVINVFVTILGRVELNTPRPHGHLAKFFLVGSGALFVGTVQGVLQVVPGNVDWLHAAGDAGRYIDPISHAHVNLITGVLSILAGVVFYVTRRRTDEDGRRDRTIENLVFWLMIPASISFYLAFIYLGFSEGRLIVDKGLSYADAADRMGWRHGGLLSATGTLTFLGVWLFLTVALWRVASRRPQGALMLGAGACLLALGTLQGVVQTFPIVDEWMKAADATEGAIAGAHAQINIIGGVLMMLLGSELSVGMPLLPEALPATLLRRAGMLLSVGALLYYASALTAALSAGFQVARSHIGGVDALSRVPDETSFGMVIGALFYTLGAALLLSATWRNTEHSRRSGWVRFKAALGQNNTTSEPWRRRIRPWMLVTPEFFSALFGFPGVGWLLSGRAAIGGPLILAGQVISWAILPMLLSPFGDRRLPQIGPETLEVYFFLTAIVSSGCLWWVLSRHRRSSQAQG